MPQSGILELPGKLLDIKAPLLDVWMPTGNNFIEHDPHGVDIALDIGRILLPGDLLERHIIERPLPLRGIFIVFREDGQPKVTNLIHTILNEHIFWFDILVEYLGIHQHLIPIY